MCPETLAKAYVLTNGVQFTPAALSCADRWNAKRQNAVYNLPASEYETQSSGLRRAGQVQELLRRPQELFLIGSDGYTVCVSAIAPVPGRAPALVDCCGDGLSLTTPAHPVLGVSLGGIEFVPEPHYYKLNCASGRPVQRWVSACGYDEMNVWPWHDCAVRGVCGFCGINSVQRHTGTHPDLLHAIELRKQPDAQAVWEANREAVISEIVEAVELAISSDCYQEEAHLIIISGNLDDSQLDLQARVYSDIARSITSRYRDRFAEGAVAVTAPPRDLRNVQVMSENGISIGVFNLEAFGPAAFATCCPGKNRIGREHYLAALREGVEVFGRGRSWCNFVLGLEPVSDLLSGCEELASYGVTPGANVLHRDYGASTEYEPPTYETVRGFYTELSKVYARHGLHPYYCQRALRTSLANEACAGRLEA